LRLTPLFFVETLADLEKEVDRGRTPEQVVGNLAEKSPTGGQPNVRHEALCVNELLGQPVEMHRVPVISGGKAVVTAKRRGLVFKQPPEMAALQRWEEGKFLEEARKDGLLDVAGTGKRHLYSGGASRSPCDGLIHIEPVTREGNGVG